MKMKGRCFLLFALLFSFVARAENVEVNGICYHLISDGIAEVTTGSTQCSGAVEIPATFTYQSVVYQVEGNGNNAFKNCSALTSIVIPEGLKTIGTYAFAGCKALTSVVFPDSLTRILAYAFSDCTSLKKVQISNHVETLGAYAFSGCSAMESVTLGSGLVEISSGAFQNCTSLADVDILDLASYCRMKITGAAEVGSCSNPFKYATTLRINGVKTTELVIPDGVIEISDCVFFGCNAIESLVVPNSVERIGKCSFFECKNLLSIALSEKLQLIGEHAFDGCVVLNGLSIPDNVVSIDNYAFNRCYALDTVAFGKNLESIGNLSFCNCSSISAIELPNKVKTIGNQCFYGCSQLATVSLPASITTIGNFAFRDDPSLSNVYCYATMLPTAPENVFMNSGVAKATLHVQESVLELYQATTPWSSFGKFEVVIDEMPQCATPTIALHGQKLSFTCVTDRVEFVSKVSFVNSDEEHVGNEVLLTGRVRVNVFARKEGYRDSEEAVEEFDLPKLGDANGDGQITIADVTTLVNIILGKQ